MPLLATLTALFALNYLWATPLFLASLRRRTLRRKPVLFGFLSLTLLHIPRLFKR